MSELLLDSRIDSGKVFLCDKYAACLIYENITKLDFNFLCCFRLSCEVDVLKEIHFTKFFNRYLATDFSQRPVRYFNKA